MSLDRLIDANANRVREALRVLEDLARFHLADAERSTSIKTLRHDVSSALRALPGAGPVRLVHRDTAGDVGTSINTTSESQRHGAADLAAAAGSRAGEALRALEEASKVLGPYGPTFERLRYRLYDLDRDLGLAMAGGRARQWRLCVILTEHLCTHHGWLEVARLAIEGGADCLQLREKGMDDADLLQRARDLVSLARPKGTTVVVNDRPDLARISEADGVHLGQGDIGVLDARRVVGDSVLIGVSTANLEQARRAARDGADVCGLGPMFPSTTKPKDTLAGPEYLRAYVADPVASRVPHLCISGITAERATALSRDGALGVAVSSAVCSSADPAAACRSLLVALDAGAAR